MIFFFTKITNGFNNIMSENNSETNLIAIVLRPDVSISDMTISAFKKRVTEQLKMMASSSLRLLEGDEYLDKDSSSTFSEVDVTDPTKVTMLFEAGPTSSPSKTMSSMKKSELVEALHEKHSWSLSELKKYTVPELKSAWKNGKLPKEERAERLANREPRKLSGYMHWMNTVGRKHVKDDFPDLKPTEVTSKCGELWRNMTEKKQGTWKKKAEKFQKEQLDADATEASAQ